MTFIKRPNKVEVFADDAIDSNYFPIQFGTNTPIINDEYEKVANANFKYGLESLENDLQMRDLNSVFYYYGKILAYQFERGVAEFNEYTAYPLGAVVTYDGKLWIATKNIEPSIKEITKPQYDPCNPCSIIEACELSKQSAKDIKYPSQVNGWETFVTATDYIKTLDTLVTKESLQETEKALKELIATLKVSVESTSKRVDVLERDLTSLSESAVNKDSLGKTIKLDAEESGKYDVNVDKNYFTIGSNGEIQLKDAVLSPLRNADIKSGSLVGSNLELVKNDESKISIPLAALVPPAKADQFLKAVSYDSVNKKLVFTVGNDLNENTNKVEVSVADLLPIVSGNGLEGDGSTNNPVRIKIKSGQPFKVTSEGFELDKNSDNLVQLTDGTGKVVLGYIFKQ